MTTRNEIVAKALSKKGNFSSYTTLKTCKTLKGFDGKIEKLTRARNIMIGAAYDNRQAVIEARANGDLPSENQGLKGKEWIQYPILLKSLANGKELIRVNVLNNSKFASSTNFKRFNRFPEAFVKYCPPLFITFSAAILIYINRNSFIFFCIWFFEFVI